MCYIFIVPQERRTNMKSSVPLGLLIKKINTSFETETNKALSKLNLTRSQLEILMYIEYQSKRNIEVNQINIEKEFNLKNPTVTGILNRLEEKKYIQRIKSEKNARFKKIIITDTANEILTQGHQHGRLMDEKVISCLTKTEYQELIKILSKIIDNITKE